MRTRFSLASAAVVVAIAACNDQPAATAPKTQSTVSSAPSARNDHDMSTAISLQNAKPIDQVGFTKVFTVQSPQVLMPYGWTLTKSAVANCPPGSFAISGGYGMSLNVDDVRIMYNLPLPAPANGWQVTLEAIPPYNGANFYAVVTCIQ